MNEKCKSAVALSSNRPSRYIHSYHISLCSTPRYSTSQPASQPSEWDRSVSPSLTHSLIQSMDDTGHALQTTFLPLPRKPDLTIQQRRTRVLHFQSPVRPRNQRPSPLPTHNEKPRQTSKSTQTVPPHQPPWLLLELQTGRE